MSVWNALTNNVGNRTEKTITKFTQSLIPGTIKTFDAIDNTLEIAEKEGEKRNLETKKIVQSNSKKINKHNNTVKKIASKFLEIKGVKDPNVIKTFSDNYAKSIIDNINYNEYYGSHKSSDQFYQDEYNKHIIALADEIGYTDKTIQQIKKDLFYSDLKSKKFEYKQEVLNKNKDSNEIFTQNNLQNGIVIGIFLLIIFAWTYFSKDKK